MKILILFAHPRFSSSLVQRAMSAAVAGLEHVAFHDLYAAYPDFGIDVRVEQQRLLDHDVIVLQHPFYWYSSPAIIKEWQDLVLENGWAYGPGGTRLGGPRPDAGITGDYTNRKSAELNGTSGS